MGGILGNIYESSSELLQKRTLASSLITGLIPGSGCEFRTNVGDDTLVDVDTGKILLVDFSDIDNPSMSELTVLEQTGLSHPAGQASRIDVNSSGIVQINILTGQMTQTEKINGNTQIGIIGHIPSASITDEFVTISAIAGTSPVSNAQMYGSGIHRTAGLDLTFAETDLGFGRAAGSYFDPLAPNFFFTPKDPHNVSLTAISPLTFVLSFRDGAGGFTFTALTTQLNVIEFDDGDGTLGNLTGMQAQNFRIYEAKTKTSTFLIVTHGQTQFPNVDDAAAAVNSEADVMNPQTFGSAFRGTISCGRGVTNLNSAIDSGAAIYSPPIDTQITTKP